MRGSPAATFSGRRGRVDTRWKLGAALLAAGLVVAALLSPQGLLTVPAHGRHAAPMPPKTVLLIRHAEKPPDDEQSTSLSKRGGQRADALHRLFEPSGGRPARFPRPDAVFA